MDLPAKAHATVFTEGKQCMPMGCSQVQRRVQITTQLCRDEAGPKSSWEISPLIRIRLSAKKQHGDCRADLLLLLLPLVDRSKAAGSITIYSVPFSSNKLSSFFLSLTYVLETQVQMFLCFLAVAYQTQEKMMFLLALMRINQPLKASAMS